ncbi:MAG: hypothetical protein ACYCPS_00580 [Candidatus Saccharimonadales bacterium]
MLKRSERFKGLNTYNGPLRSANFFEDLERADKSRKRLRRILGSIEQSTSHVKTIDSVDLAKNPAPPLVPSSTVDSGFGISTGRVVIQELCAFQEPASSQEFHG